MRRDVRFLFGPLAALIFAGGVIALALLVPHYDPIRQMVSEIGESGSPARWRFTLMLCVVALCVGIFALALTHLSVSKRRNLSSPLCLIWMAVSTAALGLFAYPHPLHNWFGMSQLFASQAPLAFALTWRNEPGFRRPVQFSAVMAALGLLSLAINLTALFSTGEVRAFAAPFYGLIQRSVFGCFFIWTAVIGWMLWRRAEPQHAPRS